MSQQLTKREYADMLIKAERSEPTRARVVSRLTDALDRVRIAPNRRERRRRSRAHRHPTRTTSQERRRKHWSDPRIKKTEEFQRRMRRRLERAPDEDGIYAGVLEEVAEHASEQLVIDFGLDPEEHQAGMAQWVLAKFGDVLRDPDVQGYMSWRYQVVRTDRVDSHARH